MTSDGCSSYNCSSFQVIGLHGLKEDFKMKYYNVVVTEVKEEEHAANNYRKNVDKTKEEFGVDEKVVMIATDNENKMSAAFTDEERRGCIAHLRLAR